MNKTHATKEHLDSGLVICLLHVIQADPDFSFIVKIFHKNDSNTQQSKATIEPTECTRHLTWLCG